MERLTERREDGTATGIKRSIGDFVGIPEMLVRLAEYEDTGMTPQDIASLESQLQQAQAELNETYIDEDGETWFRPTAEAYYAVCKARNKWQEQSEEWRLDRDFFLVRLEDEKTKVEKLEAENAGLRADNIVVLNLIRKIDDNGCNEYGKCRYCGAIEQVFDDNSTKQKHEQWCPKVIINNTSFPFPHPGDSLLKELDGLRKVAEAAREYLEADGSITAQKLFDTLAAAGYTEQSEGGEG